jgi:8-oxo-dGTP pyrophosphatase MutT (NUDIX family)
VTKDGIIEAILTSDKNPINRVDYHEPVKSAVLVVIHGRAPDWQILFTKRAEHLSSHPGQISFPGGRLEPTDASLMHTAIREAEEEVGLSQSLVKVEATLAPVVTLTGYEIHPYITFMEQLPELILDHNEVEAAFNIPLRFLIHEANIELISKQIGDRLVSTYRFDWHQHVIWGATANIVADLLYRIRQSGLLHVTNESVESY